MILPSELEARLRTVEVLSGIQVEPVSPLLPFAVRLTGFVHVHGAPKFYEAQIDLRDIKTANDVFSLIEALLKAFRFAETSAEAKVALH